MKKNKLIITTLLLFCISSIGFAATQKTFTTRDDIYKKVDNLCRIAGVTSPSSFSPMTGRSLEIALNRIDRSKLSAKEEKELEDLYLDISGEDTHYLYSEDFFKANLRLNANLQFNIADYEDFHFYYSEAKDRRNEQAIPYRYEDAAITVYPELYFGNNLFIEADFSMKNNNHHMFESSLGWFMTDYYGFSFWGERYATAYAPELPYKAGLAYSNDYLNFIVGRYPHGIGSGITGNLIVGDNFIYQEISNLSFVSNLFTYNMSITRFDQQTEPVNNITSMSRNELRGDQQFRVDHRFDINLFDKVRVAIDLATLYNSTYGFDVRFFYPFVIGHNYYNYDNYISKKYFDEANNLMGITLEASLYKGLSLSLQFALDQFQLHFEDKTSVPSAYGVLANLKYTKSIGNGTLNTWAEGVYTNPYIYLNGKKNPDNGLYDFNLDYVVGYHMQYVADIGYSGYQYGPDALVFSLGGEYISNDNWNFGGNILYKAQGNKGFTYSAAYDIKITDINMNNAFVEASYEDRITSFLSTGWENAEHLIQVKVNGGYEFTNCNIELFGVGCVNTYINHNFEPGKIDVRPQFSFGMKWHGLN